MSHPREFKNSYQEIKNEITVPIRQSFPEKFIGLNSPWIPTNAEETTLVSCPFKQDGKRVKLDILDLEAQQFYQQTNRVDCVRGALITIPNDQIILLQENELRCYQIIKTEKNKIELQRIPDKAPCRLPKNLYGRQLFHFSDNQIVAVSFDMNKIHIALINTNTMAIENKITHAFLKSGTDNVIDTIAFKAPNQLYICACNIIGFRPDSSELQEFHVNWQDKRLDHQRTYCLPDVRTTRFFNTTTIDNVLVVRDVDETLTQFQITKDGLINCGTLRQSQNPYDGIIAADGRNNVFMLPLGLMAFVSKDPEEEYRTVVYDLVSGQSTLSSEKIEENDEVFVTLARGAPALGVFSPEDHQRTLRQIPYDPKMILERAEGLSEALNSIGLIPVNTIVASYCDARMFKMKSSIQPDCAIRDKKICEQLAKLASSIENKKDKFYRLTHKMLMLFRQRLNPANQTKDNAHSPYRKHFECIPHAATYLTNLQAAPYDDLKVIEKYLNHVFSLTRPQLEFKSPARRMT